MTAYSRHTQTAYSTKRKKENPRKLNERRGSRLKKTTFNEFMESVLETRQEIFHNSLCTLLAQPPRKSILQLRMLPRRYLDEATHRPALGRELFHQCCKKKNHYQSLKQEARDYVYTFMHPEEYTLTASVGYISTSSGRRGTRRQ